MKAPLLCQPHKSLSSYVCGMLYCHFFNTYADIYFNRNISFSNIKNEWTSSNNTKTEALYVYVCLCVCVYTYMLCTYVRGGAIG
jgi:hypothetical protein